MKYLCLIYFDETGWTNMSEAEREKGLAEQRKYTDELQKSGRLLGSNALQPTGSAVTVKVRDSKLLITDGPFTETKEQLGGYYLIKASDINEAIQTASENPGSQYGTIEVRPIWEIPRP